MAGGDVVGRRPAAVHARRNRSLGPVVGIVGAATGAGRLLASRLAIRDDVRRVVAVDSIRGDVDGVTWRILDVTDPALVSRLAGCDVVVHAAVEVGVTDDTAARSRHNVRGTQTVLTAAAAASVKRVVVVTSAMVYGAQPDNAVPLPDDAPLRATPDGALISDLLEIEALCERSRRSHPGTTVIVVRPAALAGPGIDTVLTRHFEAPRLLVVRGSTPAWQFCHVDDLASALEMVVLDGLEGPLTVGSEGWLSRSEVEALSGRASIELPASFAFGTAERLHRIGVTPAPASELHYVTHPWVVSSQRLRSAGWRPSYDNAMALEALLDEVVGRHAVASRRIGRRETATLGAAGATVAVLGTAAVVRRARRRRRS
jgi:nucleoside-diphosphate-sugar epimerase